MSNQAEEINVQETMMLQFLSEGLKRKTGASARIITPGSVGALIDQDEKYRGFLKSRTIEQNPYSGTKPVDVITFCENPDYLGIKLKPKQAEILWRFNHEMDPLTSRNMWKEFVGKIGMRSGKTVMASCQEGYELYNLLMLENPQEYYGLTPGQEIYLINVAASETQSKDTIFAHLRARVENSRWFKKYIGYLKSFGRIYRGDYLYRELEARLEFHDKHIICVSMNSNSLTNVGKTAKAAFFDEIAKFKTTEGKDSADEVYSSIGRATTTFGWNGHVWSISSSLNDTDKIEELYETALKGEVKGMLGYHLSTWEANPSITRADLDREYVKNEILAKRDYECIPPKTREDFILNSDMLKSLIFVGRQPLFTASKVIVDVPQAGKINKYVRLVLDHTIPQDRSKLYFGHGDPGWNDDSFCFGVGHLEFLRRTDRGVALTYPKCIMDAVLEWKPDPALGAVVDFLDVTSMIKTIHDYLGLSFVSFDRWNAIQMIQELLDYGIVAEDLKFTDQGQYNQYINLKRVIGSGQFESFNGDEATFDQFKNLQIINGTRIDHKKKGAITDKDRCDTWAAICAKAMQGLIDDGINLNDMNRTESKMCREGGLVPPRSRLGGGMPGLASTGGHMSGTNGLGAFVR